MKLKYLLFSLVMQIACFLSFSQIQDFDGNSYQTVVIGTQEWMAENLITTHFSNGDPIPNVPDYGAFYTSGAPAWAYYANDINHGNLYGKLYNGWVAVDSRNCCPTGWRVPTVADWTTLIDFLGGSAIAGEKLKNNSFWNGTDEVGFNALPGGARYPTMDGNAAPLSGPIFSGQSYFWSSEYDNSVDIFYYRLDHWANNAYAESENYTLGMSIRCIKNSSLGLNDNGNSLKSRVYPNPFSANATVILNQNINGSVGVKVYTITGQLIREFNEYSGNSLRIERNGLSEGLYLYEVRTDDNKLFHGKFVIKK